MIIVGDINIPTNKKQHPDTALFGETLDGLNSRDHVDMQPIALEIVLMLLLHFRMILW